ncbi:hypothetical protein [Actinoallomurus sp. NPDC050550]|uniref:hypothetical protein n=1 Tax=Actinoallomurus sp. NPDC050550 TaxID=3154937 RepID=UPI0033C61FCD
MSERDMHDAMDAAEALARAQDLDSAVRGGSRWAVRYQLVYGVAIAITVAVVGLLGHPVGTVVGTVFWLVTLAALIVYALRQPVIRRGFGQRHSLALGASTMLYIVTLFTGTSHFEGDPAWWLPGAVVVALPAFIGAYVAARR